MTACEHVFRESSYELDSYDTPLSSAVAILSFPPKGTSDLIHFDVSPVAMLVDDARAW